MWPIWINSLQNILQIFKKFHFPTDSVSRKAGEKSSILPIFLNGKNEIFHVAAFKGLTAYQKSWMLTNCSGLNYL